MKTKYITTKSNPIFKEGVNIDKTESTQIGIHYFEPEKTLHINDDVLRNWIEKGYIKELEEPEFTKSDILAIVGDWLKTERGTPFDQYLDNRIKNRDK